MAAWPCVMVMRRPFCSTNRCRGRGRPQEAVARVVRICRADQNTSDAVERTAVIPAESVSAMWSRPARKAGSAVRTRSGTKVRLQSAAQSSGR